MAVNENLHSYNDTTVTSNTPAGGDAIGSDLDDHLRDIKKNVRFAAQLTPSSTSSAAVTMVQTDLNKMILVAASAAARTVSVLTAAAAATGFRVGVKKVGGANNVVVLRSGSDTIDGATAITLSATNQAVMLASNGTTWARTSEYLPGGVRLGDANVFTKTQSWSKGSDISSASTLVLGDDGNYFDVTGTTGPITAITVPAGTLFMLQFDSTPVLTHHATNLNLPGSANITAAAGDTLVGFATAANQVKVLHYQRATGRAGWELISSATASSDATIEFNNLSSAYSEYLVVMAGIVPVTDATHLYLRTSTNNGSSFDSGSSDYRYAGVNQESGGTTLASLQGGSAAAQIQLTREAMDSDVAHVNFNCNLWLYDPTDAQGTFCNWTLAHERSSATLTYTSGAGDRDAAGAVDAIQFLCSSGNIESGEFYLYGVRKA